MNPPSLLNNINKLQKKKRDKDREDLQNGWMRMSETEKISKTKTWKKTMGKFVLKN